MNILVSAISFINKHKPGSEIYTTFANRLVDNTLSKTPFDIMVTTNASENFEQKERVIIRQENLDNHKVHVKFFNQMLKFYALRNIDPKYDWVLYLDCDAGFIDNIDVSMIEQYLSANNNYDMFGVRTNATLIGEEQLVKEYLDNPDKDNIRPPLFYEKFVFYKIKPEWYGACLPSEHILLLKNNEKLQHMSLEFERFCTEFENQNNDPPIAADMEAFEIGVSAHIAGYNVFDLGHWGHHELLKVGFNYNNFEKVKY
jgi:hypothetical protein